MTEYDKVIHPGGVGKVTASVDSKHLKGAVSKSVTITTNDPEHTTTQVTIKADVQVPIDVQPNENVFLQGKAGEIKPSELTITASDGKVFDILDVQKSDEKFVVEIKPAPAAGADTAKQPPPKKQVPGGPVATGSSKYLMTVGLPPDATIGRTYGTITLKTSHPKVDSLPIRVNAQVLGAVEVVPERLFFSSALPAPVKPPTPADAAPPTTPPAPPPAPQHVKLRRTDGTPLKIESVQSSDPDFKTKLTTVTEGKEYDVEVSFVGKTGKGTVSAEITVKTNEPKQPEIKIPVVGRV